MVIDAMGGALQLEHGTGMFTNRFQGKTYDTV